MRKFFIFLMLLIMIVAIPILGFNHEKVAEPNSYYKVYYEGKNLGVITSKEKLKNYINENGELYKNKYNTDNVYAPSGVQIKKVMTYNGKTTSINNVYNKIKKQGSFTIDGYDMEITKINDEKTDIKHIYVLDKNIFKEAVNILIKTYVGEDEYQAYIDENQMQIETTGKVIENVYIDENITSKKIKVPVDKKIYTDANELAKYLLYGDDYQENNYIVKAGDTTQSVAFENKISTAELLLSNDTLTSENNLLYPGQQLKIVQTNPQISIVEESHVVEDKVSTYKVEEKYDASMLLGDEKVIQQGKDGLERVAQNVKKINNEIVYVAPKSKQIIEQPITKVIVKGSKQIPSVGSLTNWGWPTESGWTLSSGYSYRSNPFGKGRELHTGLDISGTGYNSKIFATNNGVVKTATYHYSYGNYVVINHNNGYLTLYAHMSKIAAKKGQIVEKGQVIGYVGMTGSATGPHVHYEVWRKCEYCDINPSVLYPGGYR